jgi:hypothetical protein
MENSVFFTLTMMGQLFIYLAAVNGWRMRRTRKPHPLFYLPFYFTMVNLAAVIAMARFFSGERQRVWDKAESARFAPVGSQGKGMVTSIRPLVSKENKSRKSDELETAELIEKVAKN